MRARVGLVTAGWLGAVACGLLAFAVRPSNSFTGSGSSIILAGLVLAIATDASVGAILTLRRPGNVIGLVMMLGAVLLAITLLGWVAGATLTEQRGGRDFLAGLASVIGGSGFVPSVVAVGPMLALLFPNGRLPGPRWRYPVGAIIAAIAIGSAVQMLHPGPIPDTVTTNPFGASQFSGSEAFWTIGLTLILASIPGALLLAVAAVIVRFRRSDGVERAQLKWFVAAMFGVGALMTLGFADGGLDVGLAAGTSPTIFDLLAVASLSLPAIAVGVAILRYRLFEIDRIISRTLSWAGGDWLTGSGLRRDRGRPSGAVRERHPQQHAGGRRVDARRGCAVPAASAARPGHRGSAFQSGEVRRATDDRAVRHAAAR